MFLIPDNLPVHHAKVLRPWLEKHKERIELFFMPGYSPELNPVEVANADLKKNVTSAPPPRTEEQLVENILAHYRSVSKKPKHIKSTWMFDSRRNRIFTGLSKPTVGG